jgi:hypothetical protein
MLEATLRPGILVSLKTSIKGNTTYRTQDLGTETTADGSEVSRWDTERTVRDKDEQERAIKARSLARSAVQCACIPSDFGLLCLQSNADKLDAAVTRAREIASEFNKTATVTRLKVNIVRGIIASDDTEAVRAINEEMSDLMASMAEGLQNLDVAKVREAANKAKSVGGMLTDSAKERVQAAIDVARKAARQIVSAGETGAAEIDRAAIRKVMESRTAFLDLEDSSEMEAPTQTSRPVDFEPEKPTEVQSASVQAQSRMFDL